MRGDSLIPAMRSGAWAVDMLRCRLEFRHCNEVEMKHCVLKRCSHVGWCREHFVEFDSTLIKTLCRRMCFFTVVFGYGMLYWSSNGSTFSIWNVGFITSITSPPKANPFFLFLGSQSFSAPITSRREQLLLFSSSCILSLCTTPLFTFLLSLPFPSF